MRLRDLFIYGVGFLAQALFAFRMISQWIQSERAKEAISATIFWRASLAGSFMFLIYGILRQDAVIIFGQLLSYFIYIRNLQLKDAWHSIHPAFRAFTLLLPVITIGWLYSNNNLVTIGAGIRDLTTPIILIGAIGQLMLNLRFVYQWIYSEKLKSSVLPFGFWAISVAGSVFVIIYASYRLDPVLLVAQLLGFGIYMRNIMLGWKETSSKEQRNR